MGSTPSTRSGWRGRAAEETLRSDLASQADRIEGMTHQVAVGGLRLQVAGWFLVLSGVVVGAIAEVVQSWAA
jgi:hypothetical protein